MQTKVKNFLQIIINLILIAISFNGARSQASFVFAENSARRFYSEDQNYYLEAISAGESKDKRDDYDKIAFFKNTSPPQKVWENKSPCSDYVWISLSGKRVINICNHINHYYDLRKDDEVLTIYDETGKKLSGYRPLDVYSDTEILWDGSVNIIEAEKKLDIGTRKRNKKYPDCDCKMFDRHGVLSFDLISGKLTEQRLIDDLNSDQVYPDFKVIRGRLVLKERNFYSRDKNYRLQIIQGAIASFYDEKLRRPLWTRKLPDIPEQVIIAMDGGRIVLFGKYYGIALKPNEKVLTILNKDGVTIRQYDLQDIVDLDYRFPFDASTLFWSRFPTALQSDSFELIIRRKRDGYELNKKLIEEEDGRAIRFNSLFTPKEISELTIEYEKILFNVLTGNQISRTKIDK